VATPKLTPGESVTIRESTDELLKVEGRWAASGSAPPKHFHPAQDEQFEVLEGELAFRVGGEQRTLAAGESMEIPRGVAHQVWNEGETPARAIWQTRPAGRTESWFRAIDSLHRDGRVRDDGLPGPLAFGVMLTEYRDVFRLVGPDFLLRPALGMLGALGRARGYDPAP
jgi:mannose-6-phosphate isomerase-like protein (cupin superfamily)